MRTLEEVAVYAGELFNKYGSISGGYWTPDLYEEENSIIAAGGYVKRNSQTAKSCNALYVDHSFFDIPSIMDYPYREILWTDNGVYHRDNNLPARISLEDETVEWYVKTVLHRTDGPATIDQDSVYWSLFGYDTDSEEVGEIVTRATSIGLPLYLSWLVTQKVVSLNDVTPLLDDEGKWTDGLPLTWVMKTLDITKELFDSVLPTYYSGGASDFLDGFEGFLRVAEHLETQQVPVETACIL